jgi:hypothetical protein
METEYEQINKPWNELYKEVTLGNKLTVNVGMEDMEIPLLPSNFLTKVRVSMSGGYITVRRVRIKIIPLVSRKAGVSGKLYLRDISDMTGRKLHCTELLDLGKEIRLSMQHLDFSVSTRSDVPIVFGRGSCLTLSGGSRTLQRLIEMAIRTKHTMLQLTPCEMESELSRGCPEGIETFEEQSEQTDSSVWCNGC